MNDATPPPGLSRRGFLQLTAAGAAALAVLGTATQLSGCSQQHSPAAAGYQWLTDADLPLLSVLIKSVAGPSLPGGDAGAAVVTEGLRRIDLSCMALGGPAQAQLRQLFDLLQWAPFRRFAGGVAKPWPEASAEDMNGLLDRFSRSRLSLFNGAMRALSKLGATAF